MKNPVIYAKEELGLSQRKIATLLNVSQQYVQRVEAGQCPSLPEVFTTFYNQMLNYRQRRDIGDKFFDEAHALTADHFSRQQLSIKLTFINTVRIEDLYRAYVLVDRWVLPDLFKVFTTGFTNQYTKRWFLSKLLESNDLSISEVSKMLHINQVVAQRYFEDLDEAMSLPPDEMFIALSLTNYGLAQLNVPSQEAR